MCGVIGIVTRGNAAAQLYYGMTALQHRGQDAAGMLTLNGGPKMKKGLGHVDKIFSQHDIQELDGNIGIGHTRYPTASSNNKHEDAHPFLVSSTKRVGMIHNGNLTNYYALRELLKKRGVFLETENDVEMMSKIFAHEYEKKQDVFFAVERLMARVKGAYSVLTAIEDVGLVAFRDPNGIRPLMLGKNENGYCLASESIVFQQLGYERVRDLEAGEVILITKDLEVTNRIIKQKTAYPCMFEWVYFARPDSIIDDRAVYNARLQLGVQLAKIFEKEVDVVIPVPDTARTTALKFAETIGVKYREGLIKNRYSGRTFIMPDQKTREQAVSVKLNPIITVIKDKRVAVVDDSIVRGTTSKRIVMLLRNAGAKEVHFISACPPIKNPCFYGIDFPTDKELIAGARSVDEIREYMGADSLTYQSIEGVKTACKKTSMCMACLDGKYPLKIPMEQQEVMAAARAEARKC
ncbi:MAG: amidophosphoribosyltransferase [Candidatus Woesearchaeota archaeon]|nr:amidophosphoribosyltransferase [Candidatus Woesearchaeota archaeon]